MTDSIMMNGKKYSIKKEIEDMGCEGYNITSSDMGKHLVVVREHWHDPKSNWGCFSSSLISKEPLTEKPLSDKEVKKTVAKILKDHPEWRLGE